MEPEHKEFLGNEYFDALTKKDAMTAFFDQIRLVVWDGLRRKALYTTGPGKSI